MSAHTYAEPRELGTFQAWPKIARLNREMTVTEKIDGTNAAVGVMPLESRDDCPPFGIACAVLCGPGTDAGPDPECEERYFGVYAQSRRHIITPDADNHGFAKWVHDHALELAAGLGEGLHFGEWWGSGIQRGYGLPKGEKHFSLFNTARWHENSEKYEGRPGCCDVVPILYEGPFDTAVVNRLVVDLARDGSAAAPGFRDPEGVVAFHHAANLSFKTTIKDDESPKSAKETQ